MTVGVPDEPGPAERLVVVSGLPRSGTSMLMRMLGAGGLELICDGERPADAGNPHGYFEDRRVKSLREDASWLAAERGRAVKVVSPLLRYLPDDLASDVVLVRRDLAEVLASQRALLELRGAARVGGRMAEGVAEGAAPGGTPDAGEADLAAALARLEDAVARWIASRPRWRVLELDHRRVIENPAAASRRLCEFLGRPLDCAAMARAVDPELYRCRREGEGGWTRREVLGTLGAAALAARYALAAEPVGAESVGTPAEGLAVGSTAIPLKGGEMPAYFARPVGAGPFPVVLVVHEIFGVHEYVRDVCRRLAKLGCLAVAPDLFFRHGDATQVADVGELMQTIVAKVSDAEVTTALDATLAWTRSNHGDFSRAAITGFCWGGRVVWLYCDYNPTLRAGVAWYGRLTGEPSERTPRFPVDVAPTLKVPVLGLYAGDDAGIPPESVERMRTALAAARGASEIVVYPGAPHGFHADYRPSYRPEAAADAWRRLTAWLQHWGVA